MEWKRVPGYDGSYEATACGRIRRRHADGSFREIDASAKDRHGFVRVNVRINEAGKIRKARAAQMVALAWVPKPTPGHRFAYPVNGSPGDVRAENLAWKRNPVGRPSDNHELPRKPSYRSLERSLDVLLALSAGSMPYRELAACSGIDLSPLRRLCPILRDRGLISHTGNDWQITDAGRLAIPQLYECKRERALLGAVNLGAGTMRRRMSVRLRYAVLSVGRCALCGRSASDGATLHVDHIVPVSKGGTNDRENLQALCWECNMGKSDTLDAGEAA